MAKEHLVKARELIAAGWVKTDLKTVVGGKVCYCLDGALAEAHSYEASNNGDNDIYGLLVNDEDLHQDVVGVLEFLPEDRLRTVNSYIRDMERIYNNDPATRDRTIKEVRVSALWKYNDASTTTQQDVLDVLDRAIISVD